jgi:DNA-binding response OmpR family regulator
MLAGSEYPPWLLQKSQSGEEMIKRDNLRRTITSTRTSRSFNATRLEWQLIEILLDSPDPVSIEEIARQLYKTNGFEEKEEAVRSAVQRLRTHLHEIGEGSVLLTVFGHGYAIGMRE